MSWPREVRIRYTNPTVICAHRKIAWIDQVYNLYDTSIPTLADAFPMLKAIVWFSNFTYESETGFNIDWTLTSNQEVNDHYREVVADPYFIKAP